MPKNDYEPKIVEDLPNTKINLWRAKLARTKSTKNKNCKKDYDDLKLDVVIPC